MKRVAVLAALLTMFLVGTGQMAQNPPGNSTVDRLLDFDESSTVHAFTDEDYLRKRDIPVKGAVCFFFDDGDTSFFTEFVALSDSMFDGLGAYSAYAGIRIRGTSAVIPSNVTGTGRTMTVPQLQALNSRQDEFELACHGDSDQRFGWRGLAGSGGLVSYAGETEMGYAFITAGLGAYQDSAVAWGILPFRSYGAANWRRQLAANHAYRESGIFQCKTLATTVTSAQAGLGNENFAQSRNDDPLPPAMWRRTANYFGGYQRIGGMIDPYDIGAAGSFNEVNDFGNTDSIKCAIDIAAHTSSIWIKTFHTVHPTDTLAVHHDSLAIIMGHFADRIKEGVLDSVTFEQAAARMRGKRVGNLVQHYGFRAYGEDGIASPLTETNAPFGWAQANGTTFHFYYTGPDTFVTPTTGAAAQWKVMDLSADNVILDAFGLRADYTDSLTYAAADTSRNVIHQLMSGKSNSDNLSLPIIVTGTKAEWLQVTLQAMFVTAADSIPPDNWYFGAKAGQFVENVADVVNGGSGSYASMADIVGGRNNGPAWTDMESVRIFPQFAVAVIDTTNPGVGHTTGDGFNVERAQYAGLYPGVLPYMAQHNKASWTRGFTQGNWTSGAQNAQGRNQGTAGDALEDNYEQLTDYARPTQWVWYIPINDRTDIVYFTCSLERITLDLGAAEEIIITGFEAQAF